MARKLRTVIGVAIFIGIAFFVSVFIANNKRPELLSTIDRIRSPDGNLFATESIWLYGGGWGANYPSLEVFISNGADSKGQLVYSTSAENNWPAKIEWIRADVLLITDTQTALRNASYADAPGITIQLKCRGNGCDAK